MDNAKKEILSLINNTIQVNISNKDIGNLRSDFSRYAPVTEISEYDKYKIEEFLVLYKIDRLVDLNIISEQIAKLLKELYSIKLEMNKRIREEVYKQLMSSIDNEDDNLVYNSQLLPKLYEKIEIIDMELNKFHLIPDNIELETVIDALIKNESYKEITIEELNRTVKSIKSK